LQDDVVRNNARTRSLNIFGVALQAFVTSATGRPTYNVGRPSVRLRL